MKIFIESNVFIPGVERQASNAQSVDFDRGALSLREFLEELAARALPTHVEYVRPGAEMLDPYDWQVEINGVPYQNCTGALDAPLKEGDTVNIRVLVLGGG